MQSAQIIPELKGREKDAQKSSPQKQTQKGCKLLGPVIWGKSGSVMALYYSTYTWGCKVEYKETSLFRLNIF